jgi:hypothetical protein
MTPFSVALLRQRFNAVIVSIQFLSRLACRFSASPRPFPAPPSSNFLSTNAIPRLSFDVIPTRYYFRFAQHNATSLSRRFEHRIQKFQTSCLPPPRVFSSPELRPSFRVALHNVHFLHPVAPTPTLLPLNSFRSYFVRQFHFTSRTALPTFITLFQADSP